MSNGNSRYCEANHARTTPATVKVVVKTSRIGSAGRAMVRERDLCRRHAAELMSLGFEVVGPSRT
jgi:hypothetical protein